MPLPFTIYQICHITNDSQMLLKNIQDPPLPFAKQFKEFEHYVFKFSNFATSQTTQFSYIQKSAYVIYQTI